MVRLFATSALLAIGLAACSDSPAPLAPPETTRSIGPSFAHASSGQAIAGQYLVRFRDNEADLDGQINRLVARHGGRVAHIYRSAIKGMAIEIPEAAAAALRADPRVLSVVQNYVISIATVQVQSGATWGIDRVDQRLRPLRGTYVYGADGTGVTVYIIDSGINFSHAEYAGRAFPGIDEVTSGGTSADCNGHGSHVAGTVGGTTYGVAKQVKLVAVRVLNCAGEGTLWTIMSGVDWVTAQKNAAPSVPSVANMSIGGPYSPDLNAAVENSIAAGVVYAISAGNGDANGNPEDACNKSPASSPSAITVGATTITDARASFSNIGSCVKINAPGVNIRSAWIGSTTAIKDTSGTSMASPHVAGAAALYLQTNPTATAAQVRSALVGMATANVLTGVPVGTPNLLLYTAPAPPLTATWSTPTYVGHSAYCQWTASISGGAPPYSYNWNATWTTPNTGLYFTSGQGTAAATSYSYYYPSWPGSTPVSVTLSGTDASGEPYTLQKSISLYSSQMGCGH